jgi:hypothetical protein
LISRTQSRQRSRQSTCSSYRRFLVTTPGSYVQEIKPWTLRNSPSYTQLHPLLTAAQNANPRHLLWFSKWKQRNPSQNRPPRGSLLIPNNHHFFSVLAVPLPAHSRNAQRPGALPRPFLPLYLIASSQIPDDRPALVDAILLADALIISCPIYTRQPAGLLKAFTDTALGPFVDAAFVSRALKQQAAGIARFKDYVKDYVPDERVLKNRGSAFGLRTLSELATLCDQYDCVHLVKP